MSIDYTNLNKRIVEQAQMALTPEQRLQLIDAKVARAETQARQLAELATKLKRFELR